MIFRIYIFCLSALFCRFLHKIRVSIFLFVIFRFICIFNSCCILFIYNICVIHLFVFFCTVIRFPDVQVRITTYFADRAVITAHMSADNTPLHSRSSYPFACSSPQKTITFDYTLYQISEQAKKKGNGKFRPFRFYRLCQLFFSKQLLCRSKLYTDYKQLRCLSELFECRERRSDTDVAVLRILSIRVSRSGSCQHKACFLCH